ncbi:MAG: tRNA (adenosine(37)-N6)-threonylcarbamoyltransferase complex ATPase subunit type 1 TsaE [Bacteroidetes bacterium]|nr:tRNA (adenosine(37)-N6)-threonylcarbamoyltransferase complex ATPase subunit type 1 TsaE [Bacteroidota bacterium]
MKLADDILVTTSDPSETHMFGLTLAAHAEPGDIICLHGDLGAGKTAFVKGFAEGMGVNPDKVNSPTFTLIHEYREGSIPLFHFDAYRIKNIQEALEIGTEDYLYDDGICLIEWPDKMGSLIPKEAIHIYIEKAGPEIRTFRVTRGT